MRIAASKRRNGRTGDCPDSPCSAACAGRCCRPFGAAAGGSPLVERQHPPRDVFSATGTASRFRIWGKRAPQRLSAPR